MIKYKTVCKKKVCLLVFEIEYKEPFIGENEVYIRIEIENEAIY